MARVSIPVTDCCGRRIAQWHNDTEGAHEGFCRICGGPVCDKCGTRVEHDVDGMSATCQECVE